MVQLFLAVLGSPRFPKRHRPGDPRCAPASRSAQTPTTAAAPARWRPVVLDDSPPLLVPLGRGPPHCQTRDCGRLASRRFSTLLALAVASVRRTAKDHATGQGFDRTPDEGESRVGRSQDSRGTAEAGLFPRGTNGGPDICVIWFGAVIPARGGSPFSRITAR
jgi:hypothetical protein